MSTESESLTVFIVDDNPGDRTLIRRMLDDYAPGRFQVEEAWNLTDALRRLRVGGIDLLLLDLNLPDSRGVATLSKVQTVSPGLPVIVVTGAEDRQVVAASLGSNDQNYFVKGQVNAQLLGRTIDRCLSTNDGQEESGIE